MQYSKKYGIRISDKTLRGSILKIQWPENVIMLGQFQAVHRPSIFDRNKQKY